MSWTLDDPECHGTGIFDSRGVEIIRIEQRTVLRMGFDITPIGRAHEPAVEHVAVAYAPEDHLAELLGPPPRHAPDEGDDIHDDDLVSHTFIASEEDEYWDDDDDEDE